MKVYKHIVIGGGIVGSGIAYELANLNQEVLVLEAKTISSQTSSASSKMLHGGIRYLENLDFKLVFEALKEKNYWVEKKPQFCKEAAFYLPVYKESKYPLWFMKLGTFIYNLLSLFKNKQYKNLKKKNFHHFFPSLKQQGLKGATVYSDAVIDDKEFTIEIANDAKNIGAHFKENTQVLSIIKKENHYVIETNNGFFRCEKLIIAAGPFTDKVMQLTDIKWDSIILPSRGAHLWIKKDSLKLEHNMLLQTKDNRVLFLINHKDKILAGTTEKVMQKDEVDFNLPITEKEKNYILDNINLYLTKTLTKEDIIGSFVGIRPLVKEPGKSSKKTSREHQIYNPQSNMYVIAGGKYTTFRVMAKDLVKKMMIA